MYQTTFNVYDLKLPHFEFYYIITLPLHYYISTS